MPSRADLPIEVRYSLMKAGFGAVSCTGVLAAFVYVVGVATAHADVREAIGWMWGGLATLLALTACYSLQYHLRRLLDRSAKVVIDSNGIHDFRRPDHSVSWAEIRDVWLHGLRTNDVVRWATLTLILHSGNCRTLDVEGLDHTPEFLAATVRSRIEHSPNAERRRAKL